jgi:glycosyltransferase involved in cell wall biosynthesis
MIADFPLPGHEPVGGPEVAVTRLVGKLVQQAIEVVVVTPHKTGSSVAVVKTEDGATVIAVPTGTRLTLARRMQPWRRRAKSAIDSADVDIVHGQGLLPGGIAAGDVNGPPIVVTARGNARADTVAAYRGFGGAARAHLRDKLARIAIERADVVIGVNPDWTVNLPRRPARFVYIPNMIDDDFFTQKREPVPGRVLFVGGTRAIKGWDLLAQAWPSVRAAIPNAHLNIVGWASDQTPPGIATREGKVLVEGWLSSTELAQRMGSAAVLAIPSQFEVSPIVLAEAWAIRLPVVAVPVGGIPALATDAAILVERKPEALAAGIEATLRGGQEIDHLVEEGRKRAEAHRPDSVAAAHVALYEELAGWRGA